MIPPSPSAEAIAEIRERVTVSTAGYLTEAEEDRITLLAAYDAQATRLETLKAETSRAINSNATTAVTIAEERNRLAARLAQVEQERDDPNIGHLVTIAELTVRKDFELQRADTAEAALTPLRHELWKANARAEAAEQRLAEAEALPQCASCGCVGELTIKWEEEQVPFLRHASNIHDTVNAVARVPVWTCNVCEQSWTDYRAESIRQHAVDEAKAALLAAQGHAERKP